MLAFIKEQFIQAAAARKTNKLYRAKVRIVRKIKTGPRDLEDLTKDQPAVSSIDDLIHGARILNEVMVPAVKDDTCIVLVTVSSDARKKASMNRLDEATAHYDMYMLGRCWNSLILDGYKMPSAEEQACFEYVKDSLKYWMLDEDAAWALRFWQKNRLEEDVSEQWLDQKYNVDGGCKTQSCVEFIGPEFFDIEQCPDDSEQLAAYLKREIGAAEPGCIHFSDSEDAGDGDVNFKRSAKKRKLDESIDEEEHRKESLSSP